MTIMNQFFSTDLAPCPYLEDRMERRLVVALGGDDKALHDRLINVGFRRSQMLAYRPACPGCSRCVPIRIPVDAFVFSRTWRRVLKRNADLAALERPPRATEEQYHLFRRYLAERHADGGMSTMGWIEYRSMVEESPPETRLIEWRNADRALMGVSLTDCCSTGLSGVYKFFEPNEPKRSLGTYIILWHVEEARRKGLPFVYLGYWIAHSSKMAYKSRFRPLERLTPSGWARMDDEVLGDANAVA